MVLRRGAAGNGCAFRYLKRRLYEKNPSAAHSAKSPTFVATSHILCKSIPQRNEE